MTKLFRAKFRGVCGWCLQPFPVGRLIRMDLGRPYCATHPVDTREYAPERDGLRTWRAC
jgi:hypothetical protein